MGKESGNAHSHSTAKHRSTASSPMTVLAECRGRNPQGTHRESLQRCGWAEGFTSTLSAIRGSCRLQQKPPERRCAEGPRGYHVPWQISHWTDIQRRWSHFTPDMQNHQQTLLVQEVLSIEFASIFLVKSMFLKSQWASQQSCSYAFWIKWEDLLWLQHVLWQILTEYSKGFLNYLRTA